VYCRLNQARPEPVSYGADLEIHVMPKQVLFIQGAGAAVHDAWDDKLVRSLERALGDGYSVLYPRMPDEADPHYGPGRPRCSSSSTS
jgi:hypothetical protein